MPKRTCRESGNKEQVGLEQSLLACNQIPKNTARGLCQHATMQQAPGGQKVPCGHMMHCCQPAADATHRSKSTNDLTDAVCTPSIAAEKLSQDKDAQADPKNDAQTPLTTRCLSCLMQTDVCTLSTVSSMYHLSCETCTELEKSACNHLLWPA